MSADVRSACPGDEDGLLQDVGAMLGHTDPIPANVREAARALPTWPTLEDELAELLAAGAPRPRPAAR